MDVKTKSNLFAILILQALCLVLISLWIFYEPLKASYDAVLFFGPSILLIILGIILAIWIKKKKIQNPLRPFLICAAYSTIYFLPATIAHNFLEVGGEMIGGFFGGVFSFLGSLFFIISVIVSPVVLLVGIVGGIILLMRKN